MSSRTEAAAVLALVRNGKRAWSEYSDLLEDADSPLALLEEEQGLLAPGLLDRARSELTAWAGHGFQFLTVLDPSYPRNLKAVHDRPPLVFLAGRLEPVDERAVAVIGSRQATADGVAMAGAIARRLVAQGFTVVSGLATGIDTAAHVGALEAGGRTIAVIGTGLARFYPRENRALQEQIAAEGAVMSRFWPDAPPSRQSFPLRNAVMSGISLATVIVEASERSGARTQARAALGQARPVLLLSSLLGQPWARELAARPGVHVVDSPEAVSVTVERLSSGTLVA